MAIPSGYTLQTTQCGSYVGPGSKFRVVAEVYAKDTGTGYHCYLRRYVQVTVPSGGSGFRGTNVTTAWAGTVSLTTAGNYAVYDVSWKTLAYGGSEPVQAQHAKAYYTSGSGNYYESSVSFTYTVPIPSFYLDLNGLLDDVSSNGISGYGTADVYINNSLVGDDVTDYYKAHPYGSTYKIVPTALKGFVYNGVNSGSLTGTITSETKVVLSFSKKKHITHVYASGTWREGKPNLYIDGSWKEVAKIGVYVGNSWKET